MRVLLLVLVLMVTTSCAKLGEGGQLHRVRYQITVVGDVTEVSVAWTGSTQHGRNATRRVKIAPGGIWQETATVPKVSQARLSAASINGAQGSITCAIYKGATVIARQTSPDKINPQISCSAELYID